MADRFVWPRRQREPAAPTRVFRESGKPKTLAAPIHGGQGSSTGCAAAGGTGLCPVQAQRCPEEAAPTRVFRESGKPKTLTAPIHGGQGSSAGCAAAGGTGHCPVQAQPARRRQRRQEFSGEFRKTADLGRFNLWRPMVVERIRGSNRLSALPTGSRCVQAQPADRRILMKLRYLPPPARMDLRSLTAYSFSCRSQSSQTSSLDCISDTSSTCAPFALPTRSRQ